MDLYDGRFFNINKKFLTILGLWPYDTLQRKNFIRAFHVFAIVIASIPQIISLRKNYLDWDRMMENSIYLLIILCSFLKMLTLGLAQKKLRIMFDNIVDNWQMIVDEKEKEILRKYSENGRRFTIAWSVIVAVVDFFSIIGPLISLVLHKINPTSDSWSYPHMLNGEYLIEDKDSNYFIIYCWDLLSTLIVTFIFVATDTTFVIGIEHCLALFAIVRYRVQVLSQLVNDDDTSEPKNVSMYKRIAETIKLHQKTLQFLELLEASFSTCFLFILGYTISGLPLCCILIVVNLQTPALVLRFLGAFCSLAIHLFNFCWAGQKLIDLSTSLVHETYSNEEWHTSSIKSRKALLIFMLRCSNPCIVTASGIFIMNFENLLLILKTAASYIMVLGSLRKVEII